jgi:hypothetical protein
MKTKLPLFFNIFAISATLSQIFDIYKVRQSPRKCSSALRDQFSNVHSGILLSWLSSNTQKSKFLLEISDF